MRRLVRFRLRSKRGGCPIAFRFSLEGSPAALRQGVFGRLSTRLERVELGRHGAGTVVEGLDLLTVKRNLLVAPGDGELSVVGHLTRLGRPRFRFDELEAQPTGVGLKRGDGRGSPALLDAYLCESAANRVDGF